MGDNQRSFHYESKIDTMGQEAQNLSDLLDFDYKVQKVLRIKKVP